MRTNVVRALCLLCTTLILAQHVAAQQKFLARLSDWRVIFDSDVLPISPVCFVVLLVSFRVNSWFQYAMLSD